MADEWIKVRRNLGNHPKIVRMMSALCADKFRTVGGLHAVWSVFDEFSEDGKLNGYSFSTMDLTIGWPGFCEAMAAVNWLSHDGESLVVPEFEEHNGQSGKRRAMESKRKRDGRKVSAERPHAKRTKSGLEEEVEEESIDQKQELPPLSPKGKKGERLPEGWKPSADLVAQVEAIAGQLWRRELPKFVDYWNGRTGSGATKLDWPGTFRNWIRKAAEDQQRRQPRPSDNPPPSRQARQLQAIEDVINDPAYTTTAQRHLASDSHRPRSSAPHDAQLALDTGPGCPAWDDDGVD